MVEVWGKGDSDKVDDYELLWTLALKTKALCMDWNSELRYLTIGCESGIVVVVKIEDNPNEYSVIVDLEVHDKKTSTSKVLKHNDVVGVYLDEENSLIYSIGEDKFLKTMDAQTKEPKDCKKDLNFKRF
jgi:hypothetical protein